MKPITSPQHNDPDIHKGAVEGDRPADEQQGNPNGGGGDKNGMPDDPVATAQVRFWPAYLMTTDKRGISALPLQRQLGLRRYETA